MLAETLQKSSNDHHHTTTEDGPSATKFVVHIGNEWQRENSTQRVSGTDDALETTLRVIKVYENISDTRNNAEERKAAAHTQPMTE